MRWMRPRWRFGAKSYALVPTRCRRHDTGKAGEHGRRLQTRCTARAPLTWRATPFRTARRSSANGRRSILVTMHSIRSRSSPVTFSPSISCRDGTISAPPSILEGEVTYPGSYGLQEGERLSSVLRRAGGLRDTAYAGGAILIRNQVKELEEKTKVELIHQIETSSASARLAPNLGSGQEQTALLQAATQQQAEVLKQLKSQPASGRLVIHISADINSWANTPADIEMHAGDVLTVPKRPGFVLVSGQVYNASALTYVPGKEASWYLRRAGGTNDVANRKEIFVIRANGSVIGRRSGEWYGANVLSTRLDPGDVIVVPQKIIGGSLFWKNLLTVAQISSSIAFTAAVAGVFIGSRCEVH